MNDNLAHEYQEDVCEELIGGQVVAMSPKPRFNHHRIAWNIANIFDRYLRGKRCTAIADGVDLYLTDKDRFVPDVMVVCDRDKIQEDGVHGAPDLVVEVLSPSTAMNDRKHKKAVYEACGVKEYWLVSPAEKSVEQYLLEDGVLSLHAVYAVHPDFMLAKMTEAERAAIPTSFQCSLFDDLDILLEDAFYGLLPG